MNTAAPYISIVILVGVQRQRAERCLASVISQQGLEKAEILILDGAADQYPPLAGSDHACARVVPMKKGAAFSQMRLQAVQLARGEVVAFIEEHALAIPGWLETIIRGFRAGHAGVGGEPGAQNPGIGISDAVALMNYYYFRPLAGSRLSDLLPGHNSAYRREVLLSFGELLPVLLVSEPLLNWKMIEKGHTLLLDPGAGFLHFNEESTAVIATGYYYWNLCFGEGRASVFRWPWWRRVLQGLAIPVVPVVRYVKYFAHYLKYEPKALRTLFRFTGVILYAQLVAAVGLAIGCLFGAGDADIIFSHYEMDHPRKW